MIGDALQWAADEAFEELFGEYGLRERCAADFRNRHVMAALQALMRMRSPFGG